MQAPIGIKQIAENLRQFQDSVQEVTRTVSNMVTRDGPVDNYVLLNEVQKFMRLWSHQIQDVSDQITRAFGGLEADINSKQSIRDQLRDLMNNMIRIFDKTADSISQSMNRLINGDQKPSEEQPPTQPLPNRSDELQKPSSNSDMLKEFKKLLEIIQKRMRILSQQLDSLLSSPTTIDNLKAEHREGTTPSSQSNLI